MAEGLRALAKPDHGGGTVNPGLILEAERPQSPYHRHAVGCYHVRGVENAPHFCIVPGRDQTVYGKKANVSVLVERISFVTASNGPSEYR